MNIRLVPLLSTLGMLALLVLAPACLTAATPPPNGPGGALSFNVGNEYLDVPDAVWFSGDFTVEGWIYVRSHNNWARLLDFGNGEGIDNVIVALSDGTTGKPHFHVVSNTFIGPGITAPNELPLNQWTHLACVLSGTTGTIYANGVAVTNGPLNRPRPVLRTGCYFGRSNWAADANANAIFDEVRIWNVARTTSQILEAMRRQLFGNESGLIACYRLDEGSGPSAFDATGNVNNTATRVNGSVWLASSIVPFAPPVTTVAASAVAATSATLNGTVDGRTSFSPFEAYFEWGTTASLGHELRSGFLVSPGAAPQNFSTPLTGLIPGATYYFRAVAVNGNGPSYGATLTVIPHAPPGLSVRKGGLGGMTLEWNAPESVLQEAAAVVALWGDVPGAASPYTTTPSARMGFFRLRTAAQVYSTNVVAYVNLTLQLGWNLIQNPLDATSTGGNSVSNLLADLPDGSTAYKWSQPTGWVVNDCTDLFGWTDPNMSMAPGEGILLFLPGTSFFTKCFIGDLMQGNLTVPLASGLNLVGSKVAQAGKLIADLRFIAYDGDIAYQMDALQGYRANGFEFGAWLSGDPGIAVGEAFWVHKSFAGSWTRTFSVNSP